MGWMLQAVAAAGPAGTLPHRPDEWQQSPPALANMKYCEHDKQPPQRKVASSRTATPIWNSVRKT
jgi:hypothetical protein